MKNKRVHFNIPGHIHELTFSCYQRRPFLRNESYCQYLADAINQACGTHSIEVCAYVFMPEHVHLLLYPTIEEYSIAEISKSIKQSCARRVMIHCRKNDPGQMRYFATGLTSKPYRFWQGGGGYDRNITKQTTLITVINYIHANPVRRGLVESPEKWHWSSFRDWNDLGEGPVKVDRESIPMI